MTHSLRLFTLIYLARLPRNRRPLRPKALT
jgi:hypothetical protein